MRLCISVACRIFQFHVRFTTIKFIQLNLSFSKNLSYMYRFSLFQTKPLQMDPDGQMPGISTVLNEGVNKIQFKLAVFVNEFLNVGISIGMRHRCSHVSNSQRSYDS